MATTDRICFTVENTLGRLAKWLRLIGFDTLYSGKTVLPERDTATHRSLPEDRILLTRTRGVQAAFPNARMLFIRSNDPFAQLRQVIESLHLTRADLIPFSRCLRCNQRIRVIERDAARGRVPDYIWATHAQFYTCHHCCRLFWPGSHTRRAAAIIDDLFGDDSA